MAFLNLSDVKKDFNAHPRRALIMTTVDHETHAVQAHLADRTIVKGSKSAYYEYCSFHDPAGNWLVVQAITPQGNSDAGLVAAQACQDFGDFHVQIFVGVAGSLKKDIPIGSVVVGDYV